MQDYEKLYKKAINRYENLVEKYAILADKYLTAVNKHEEMIEQVTKLTDLNIKEASDRNLEDREYTVNQLFEYIQKKLGDVKGYYEYRVKTMEEE